MNVWSLCIHPAVCLICVLCLRREIFVPFSLLWLFFRMKEHQEEWDEAEVTLYVQLSAYPCTCLPSLFLAVQSPRNSSLKFFSSAISWQQPRWPSVHPEDGHSVFVWTGGFLLFPDLWPKLFLKVSPVSTLIWATGCCLLLRFCCGSFHMTQWPTYLSLSLMGHILAYLVLPFLRVIRKERPLTIWWPPPTSPQVKCAAVLNFCSCVIE